MSKSWSYAQLTSQLENEIATYREMAVQAIAEDPNSGAPYHLRSRAHGAVSFWDHVTTGWQKPEDYARLEGLARAVCPTPFD